MAKPKPKPKVMSEGRRQLLAAGGSESEIAAKAGCGPAVVGHWRRGTRLPQDAQRHKLELLFGIPRGSWDVAPGAAPAVVDKPKLDVDEDILSITKQQLLDVRTALQADNMTAGARAKLRADITRLVGLRARLEAAALLQEDRIVREHPEWQRVKSAILRALKKYPEAAAAVAAELAS